MPTRSDFRSDTVTRPTMAMREAMMAAELGDDGFGDDPTVTELQRRAAEILGKEASLFCPSGTMANQIAICAHTNSGDEILVEDKGHIAWFEGGGAAYNGRVQIRTYSLRNRRLSPPDAQSLLRLDIIDCPVLRLLCVENTLNMHGGVVWPQDNLDELARWAHERDIAVHLDGARLFNAATATGLSPARLSAGVDSIMVCLSKGLGAPIGSLLVGTEEFIHRARRIRKRLGGQMRQVGILAAAGLFALKTGIERLHEDHALASRIATDIIERVPSMTLAQEQVETNIILLHPPNGCKPEELVSHLEARGVLITAFPGNLVRIVTHQDVGQRDADRLIESLLDFQTRRR